ncbi:MAG: 3-phosphoshikimate 1-carboxyvinyltransferase [Candidatus Diapherotrites archaeon]
MKSIELIPGKIQGKINAPPSKAVTLRALFIASLAEGKTTIKNPLLGEDQLHAINALKKLGVKIKLNKKNNSIEIRGSNGKLINSKKLFIGNSGVTMRFLVPIACIAKGKTAISGNNAMQKRPVGELIKAVNALGGKIISVNGNNCPPVKAIGETLKGGKTKIDCSKSSQYLSALLIASPLMKKGLNVKATSLPSKPYIETTVKLMKEFGVKVQNKNFREFRIQGKQEYKFKGKEFLVEGDYTNASYFLAAAAIAKGKIKVMNLKKNSLQGDKKIIEILSKMGAKIKQGQNFVEVKGKELHGISVDLNDFPDLVPTVAVLGACAKGKTLIKNIGHLKFKETDRIKAVLAELRKTGIKTKRNRKNKGIEIIGGIPKSAQIETYNDHRIAMAFSLLGLKTKTKINNPDCVKKSFPGFFKELNKIMKPLKKTNIVLIGLRGSGKTTLGKMIAKRMNMDFIDSDELIEKKEKRKIKRIFELNGESYFRKKEKEAIEEIKNKKKLVISCGGGVVLDKKNIPNLKKNGFVLFLNAQTKTLAKRIKGTNRPSLTGKKIEEEIKEVMNKRRNLYLNAMDAEINTGKLNKEEATEKAIELFLNEKTKKKGRKIK